MNNTYNQIIANVQEGHTEFSDSWSYGFLCNLGPLPILVLWLAYIIHSVLNTISGIGWMSSYISKWQFVKLMSSYCSIF